MQHTSMTSHMMAFGAASHQDVPSYRHHDRPGMPTSQAPQQRPGFASHGSAPHGVYAQSQPSHYQAQSYYPHDPRHAVYTSTSYHTEQNHHRPPFPREQWRQAPQAITSAPYGSYTGYHDARLAGEASRSQLPIMPPASSSSIDQEPTYIGHIKSAQDAILLLAACDLPDNSASPRDAPDRFDTQQRCPPPRRVTRRLLDAERGDLVSSGCVFAWDEKEAGMRRWTDGRVWSASRVSGCFLTYRELEARKKAVGSLHDGPSANQYKADGLIKQSFSVTTASGRKLHVISYFTKRDVREGRLRRVSEDPRFVGESGGEWGLRVDENEYVVRESQLDGADAAEEDNMAMAPGGSLPSDSSVSAFSQDEREQDERVLNLPILSRKRPLDPEVVGRSAHVPIKQSRPSVRPLMARKRSSSPDTPHSYYDTLGNSSASIESATSLNTSVPSDSSEGRIGSSKPCVVLSTSPTYPRESALRDGACEMQATDSQESANAIGALLSLAGGNSSSALPNREPQISRSAFTHSDSALRNQGLDMAKMAPSNLATRPVVQRHDSDRHALNLFRVQL